MSPDDTPLLLEGVTNFRSLDGIRTADGRRIGGHLLLRSDRLASLSQTDWQRLQQLGLRTICDLRSADERLRHPNQVPAHCTIGELWLEVRNDIRANPEFLRILAEDPTERGAERLMVHIYRGFAEAFAAQLRDLLALFEDGRVPLLIHCAAGKDRTGFVVALLLHALGVPEETIMQDYLRSSPNGPHPRLHSMVADLSELFGMSFDERTIAPILDVREAYLHAALEAVRDQYGSLDGYLESAGGLDATARERLRDRWLQA